MTRAPNNGRPHVHIGHKDVSPQVVKLSWAERLDILDGLSLLLDQVYVHLPLKRSLYGFDIIRALASLRQQSTSISDVQFHRELTTLINRLRDAHTQYQGPWTQKDVVASLPFLVEAFGPADDTTYFVSKVDRDSVKDKYFTEGVQITHWNGIPFGRALDLHADVETGGRPDSRRARALESLTFRALEYAPPPNEEWVIIDFIDHWGKKRTIRLSLGGLRPDAGAQCRDRNPWPPDSGAAYIWRRRRSGGPRSTGSIVSCGRRKPKPSARGGKKQKPAADFADFLSARTVTTKMRKIRLSADLELRRRRRSGLHRCRIPPRRGLPDRGLIIDIRNNPGGLIWAAERLLQIFTPNTVQPTKFALRTTSTTAEMARAVFNREELGPWSDSLTSAESTGEPYSAHIPITSSEQCNNIGQRYGGPVVVVAMPTPIPRAIFSPRVLLITESGRWSASVMQRVPAAPMSGPPRSGGRLAAGQPHAAQISERR